MIEERQGWDAIICGGGTAGAVVAARLVEGGGRVLMLEAGPDYGPYEGGHWPAELLDASQIPTSHDWDFVSGSELPGRRLPYERARVIGGCSAHNGCTVSWGHRADYDGWGLPGFSGAELEPLFHEATTRMRTRTFSDEELTPMHRAFIDEAQESGLARVDDLATLDGVPGVGVEPSNSPLGIRWNAAFAYLDPVRSSPGLSIRDNAVVDRLRFHRGRACAVSAIVDGRRVEFRANLVVLTAGSYGTPAILQRSGIGPHKPLRRLGIEVVADNALVGANLHDHPSVELLYQGTAKLEEATAAFAASGGTVVDEQAFAKIASSRCAEAPFDLHVFPALALRERAPSIFVAAVAPQGRGRLLITSADPTVPPSIDHGLLADAGGADRATLAEGVSFARMLAAAPTVGGLFGEETGSAAQLDPFEVCAREVVHYWHPVGSCALALACDGRGRVKGVEGAVVADASLFPQTPRATTNIPTIVLAAKIAEWLAE